MSELPVDGVAEPDQPSLPSVSVNGDEWNFVWRSNGKSVDNYLIRGDLFLLWLLDPDPWPLPGTKSDADHPSLAPPSISRSFFGGNELVTCFIQWKTHDPFLHVRHGLTSSVIPDRMR